jgi:hypothetical protein
MNNHQIPECTKKSVAQLRNTLELVEVSGLDSGVNTRVKNGIDSCSTNITGETAINGDYEE